MSRKRVGRGKEEKDSKQREKETKVGVKPGAS